MTCQAPSGAFKTLLGPHAQLSDHHVSKTVSSLLQGSPRSPPFKNLLHFLACLQFWWLFEAFFNSYLERKHRSCFQMKTNPTLHPLSHGTNEKTRTKWKRNNSAGHQQDVMKWVQQLPAVLFFEVPFFQNAIDYVPTFQRIKCRVSIHISLGTIVSIFVFWN